MISVAHAAARGVQGPGSAIIPADLAIMAAVVLVLAIIAGFFVLKALRR
jgi:hypothetical protein